MGSFNTVISMRSKRESTDPTLLPKNTFQINQVRAKKKGKSGLEKSHLNFGVL
jgi:hypothetical protein